MAEQQSLGIGTDEWVAQHEKRLARRSGALGIVDLLNQKLSPTLRYGILGIVAIAFGTFVHNLYLQRIAANLGVFLILTLGLNVVMGFAGLLDLGFVAFFGFGAYAYALTSSAQLNQHWPTYFSVPAIVIVTAFLGYLVSLPSRRLFGDYLAIVTLFFGQVFIQLILSSDSITFPGHENSTDITGGSNGIPGLDSFKLFGHAFKTVTDYYWLLLVILVLLIIAIIRVDRTRIGRAWKTVREDPLASQAMGIKVNNLKMLAFIVGASIAGLAGTIFAGIQGAVFINGFDMPLLTLIYAAVILGGSGSIPGSILGAFVMSVLPEILRVQNYSEMLFLTVLILTIAVLGKSWKKFAFNIALVILIGFLVKVTFTALKITTTPAATWAIAPVSKLLKYWLFIPHNRILWGNIAFIILISLVAYYSIAKASVKFYLLPVIAYVAIFLWEDRLVIEPSTTRQLIIGMLLVVLMIVRPQGFLGKTRVEVL
jgi:branched-chain amino acid transport system permease protein